MSGLLRGGLSTVPLYRYRALDTDGQMRVGLLGADQIKELDERLAQRGWQLLAWRRARLRCGTRRAVREFLVQFCFHLELELSAGVPILDCLRDMRADLHDAEFGAVLERVIEAIEKEGMTFSDALGEFPMLFNVGFVGLVRAGERSGSLPAVIGELHAYLKWLDEWQRRLVQQAIYPLLVLVVVLAAVFLLSAWLVPALSTFLDSVGQELPWHTRLLIDASAAVTDWWYVPIMAGFVMTVACNLLLRYCRGLRLYLDALKLRLPLTGVLLHKLLIARVVTELRTMYGAGLDLLESIRISAESTGNRALRAALHEAAAHIRDGAGLAEGFRRTGLFPAQVLRMIHIGERTGELERCLRQVGYYYNRDIKASFERLQTCLGPTLNVLLGLLLGLVIYSLLGPVYGLAIELAG